MGNFCVSFCLAVVGVHSIYSQGPAPTVFSFQGKIILHCEINSHVNFVLQTAKVEEEVKTVGSSSFK